MSHEHAAPPQGVVHESANERFKQTFSSWFWGSMIVATVAHFAVFALWPDMTAADVSLNSDEVEMIDLPPEIEIPPPPQQIARPANPVIAETEISEDITIAPTTFEDNPITNLPPPPEPGEGNISDAPVFVPFDVAPELTNRNEVQRTLEREYPPMLKESGLGGDVQVYLFIDENGVVQDRRVNVGSGFAALDEAALRVADVMEFRPALNRDKNVAVWISLPIQFVVR